MNDEPRDRELEQAYRDASRETPPRELDDRILAAAHREVGARPQEAGPRPSWVGRYRIPLSVAATALIAVTLAFMVEDESRRPPAADAPVGTLRDAPWGARSGAPAPATTDAARPDPAQAAPGSTAPSEARQAPPAAAPRDEAASRASERAAAPPPPTERTRSPAADANVVATPAPAAPMSAPAPAPAAPPARALAEPSSAPPAPGAGMESRERTAQERPSRMTRDEATSAGPRASAKSAAPLRAPEAWLEDIRRLRAEGRLAEADEALAAFRRAYPDFPLPGDLVRP